MPASANNSLRHDLEPDAVVSVVIPAHNEEERIGAAVQSVLRVFESIPRAVEVIVVDDGSTDNTYHEALRFAKLNPETVKVIALETNHGKGYAIRTGFRHSRGQVVGFIDADLEYPVNALPIMVEMVGESGTICAIATRVADDRRMLERLSSQMAHKIASALLRLPVQDTQAGMKMFPGTFAREFLTRCEQEGWLYDIEALLRAVEQRLDIIEVPVMQKSIRKRRASVWAMLSCGPAFLHIALIHWQSLWRHTTQEARQIGRFGLIGLINTLVDIAAYWALIRLWSPHRNGLEAGFESLLAWLLASVAGYTLHSRYTFRKPLAYSGFYIVTGCGVAIQVISTGLITQRFGASSALLGKLLGIALASLATYGGYRHLAKRNHQQIPKSTLVRQADIPTVVSPES